MEKYIEKVKREILKDVDNGEFPRTVKSFSELHDYVDANEYLILVHNMTGKKSLLDNLNLFNQVSIEVDSWIRSGALLPDFNDEIIALQKLVNFLNEGKDVFDLRPIIEDKAHELAYHFMDAWRPGDSMSLDEFLTEGHIVDGLTANGLYQGQEILSLFESI